MKQMRQDTHCGFESLDCVISGEAHGGEDGDALFWRLVVQCTGCREAGAGQVWFHVSGNCQRLCKIYSWFQKRR